MKMDVAIHVALIVGVPLALIHLYGLWKHPDALNDDYKPPRSTKRRRKSAKS